MHLEYVTAAHHSLRPALAVVLGAVVEAAVAVSAFGREIHRAASAQ
jgi:hypothetical protein